MSKDEVKQLSKEEKLTLVNSGNLFCIRTFLTGIARKFVNFIFETILSREFIVFIIVMLFFLKEKEKPMWLWICFVSVGIVFIIAQALNYLLRNKTTLNIDHKTNLGASVALTGDVSNIAKTAIDAAKGV